MPDVVKPIATRLEMQRLLEDVRDKRELVMIALARIEAWGDDWASRNTRAKMGGIHTSDSVRSINL